MASMLSLPNEILDTIVQYLNPDRKAQQSLTCTCRRLAEIAEPHTVREILLGETPESWIWPLRTLVQRPHLRQHIHRISTDKVELDDVSLNWNILELFADQDWSNVSEADRLLFSKSPLGYQDPASEHHTEDITDLEDWEISQDILGLLITFSTRLVILEIFFPWCGDDPLYSILNDRLADLLQGTNDFPTLPSTIRYLSIDCNLDLDRPKVSLDTCPSLFRIPSITNFSIVGHVPSDDPVELEDSPMWANIEDYKTEWLAEGGSFWYSTIARCTRLQSFSANLPVFASHGLRDSAKGLNAALLLRADTLEKLSLDFLGSNCYYVLIDLGAPGRLSCLPQLHRLRELAIDTFTLFGSLEGRGPDGVDFKSIAPAFPKSLERLELTECWDDDSGVDLFTEEEMAKYQINMQVFANQVWHDKENLPSLVYFQVVVRRPIWEKSPGFGKGVECIMD